MMMMMMMISAVFFNNIQRFGKMVVAILDVTGP